MEKHFLLLPKKSFDRNHLIVVAGWYLRGYFAKAWVFDTEFICPRSSSPGPYAITVEKKI